MSRMVRGVPGTMDSWTDVARRAGRVLVLVVVIALVVPFVVFSYPPVIGAEAGFVVLSGSMEPAIQPGDVVIVYDVDPERIEAGDVITFTREGATFPITHRVVEVIETNDDPSGVVFRTAGDANEDPDPGLLLGSQVIGLVPTVTLPVVGEVLLFIPFMGHVVQFGNTTIGFALLVGLPLALFILNEAWHISRGDVRNPPADGASTADGTAGSDSDSDPLGTDDSVDRTFAVSSTDLTITIGVLVATSAYVTWVAFTMRTSWSIAAAVAAVGCLLFFSGLRWQAIRWSPESRSSDPAIAVSRADGGVSGDAGVNRIVRMTAPEAFDRLPQVPIDSYEELRSYAEAIDGLVVEDIESGVSYLPNGGALYIAWRDDRSGDEIGAEGIDEPDGKPVGSDRAEESPTPEL